MGFVNSCLATFSNLFKKLSIKRKPKLRASDGYFMAKREMQDAIARRVAVLEKDLENVRNGRTFEQRLELTAKIQALEEARNFVRNYMLWDTTKGSVVS